MAEATLRVSLGQHSEAGPKPINQDFHGAVIPPEPLLGRKGIVVALADGIGSSAVSHIAAAAAVRGFLDDYYATSEAWPVRRAACRVLDASNAWLHAQTQRGDGRFDKDRGHVCTFSALILKGREAHLLHIGDARVYRLQTRALEQLSEDHRVRVSGSETLLGRALGVGARVEIDYDHWPIEAGEVYVLATDGAYEFLDAAAVNSALASHPQDLQSAAQALVALALERGSADNATVQLLRIEALPTADQPAFTEQRLRLRIPAPLQPRASFEGFTILRELHVSPRSHVHLAVDERSGQQVVIKTPSVALREDQAALDRFLLEEWVAQRVDNPHVLRPAATTTAAREHLFVAMEYVEGQTLAQWMVDHPQPDLDAVRQLVEQIARGLQAFHRKTMLHQDLRPENLMIDRQGTVKIIDFGSVHVAGLAEGAASPAEAILGSLQYTAPEYFVGQAGSPTSDLFAMAVLTYQMLSGQLPYGLQVTQVRTATDVQRLRYIPIRSLRPELPEWLDAVLRKALNPLPHKRQEVLTEFIEDLRAPGSEFRSNRHVALIERDPAQFWRVLSLLLAVAVIGLSALLWGRA